MTRKRYKENRAAALLARVADFVREDETAPIHTRALEDLARADLGFTVQPREAEHIDFWIVDEPAAVDRLRQRWREYPSWYVVNAGAQFLKVKQLSFWTLRRGGAVVISISGDESDLLSFQLVNLIRIAGPDRLQTCKACGTTYVRKGRKTFCSETCQKRIYMRKWRSE